MKILLNLILTPNSEYVIEYSNISKTVLTDNNGVASIVLDHVEYGTQITIKNNNEEYTFVIPQPASEVSVPSPTPTPTHTPTPTPTPSPSPMTPVPSPSPTPTPTPFELVKTVITNNSNSNEELVVSSIQLTNYAQANNCVINIPPNSSISLYVPKNYYICTFINGQIQSCEQQS